MITHVLACLFLCLVCVQGFGSRCREGIKFNATTTQTTQAFEPNLKVAFVGDSGNSANSTDKVYQQIKDFGAEVFIQLGDYDYGSNPTNFDERITKVLGSNYPVFAAIGNHDTSRWTGSTGYQQKLVDRLKRAGVENMCEGEYGVNTVCNYKGFIYVINGVGTRGSGHDDYLRTQLTKYKTSNWKICGWHKNQRLYQTGGKSDETGYAVLDTCREFGGIVATGHEHSYARTYLMSNYASQRIDNTNPVLTLEPGKSFLFCSGNGGSSLRPWRNGLEKNPWWAATASTSSLPQVDWGALLCTFNVGGDPSKAHCDFTDVSGRKWDSFDIESNPESYQDYDPINFRENNGRTIDIAVEDPDDDLMLRGPFDFGSLAIASYREETSVSLRFRHVPLIKGEQLDTVHLQMLGREANGEVSIRIHVSIGTPDALNAESFISEEYVEWVTEQEDWEAGEVWVSPNLKSLVESVISSDSWQYNDPITFTLIAKGGHRVVHAFESDACFAPSLFIQTL